jgi:hypothetical protein
LNLANGGSKPLTFRLSASCACSSLEPSDGVIQPGGARSVKVGIRLDKEGENRAAVVQIVTNDPALPSTEHTFLAFCPKYFAAEPSLLDFGLLPVGGSVTRSLTIQDDNGKPFSKCHLTEITTSHPSLIAMWATGPEEIGRLDVTLKPMPPGFFHGVIQLRCDDGLVHELTIPVHAREAERWSVAPRTVLLTVPKSDANGEASANFLVRAASDEDLVQLVLAQAPQWLRVDELGASGDLCRRFRVALVPGEPIGDQGTIRFKVGASGESVQVKVIVAKP